MQSGARPDGAGQHHGEILRDSSDAVEPEESGDGSSVEHALLSEIYDFASGAGIEETGFIREAFRVNGELSDAAFHSARCTITSALLRSNGGVCISDNAEKSALVLAASAAEARVLGLNYPAMSITGSGNHGIIGASPEQTMRNIGYIADPGMTMTEQAIVGILREKEG